MNSTERKTLNRRDVLRQGGLALSLGALVAACGSGRSGSDAPGRIGVIVPPENETADLTVDDAVLLRTLQSLANADAERRGGGHRKRACSFHTPSPPFSQRYV